MNTCNLHVKNHCIHTEHRLGGRPAARDLHAAAARRNRDGLRAVEVLSYKPDIRPQGLGSRKRRQRMGERPRHRKTWRATRCTIALLTAIALNIAPLVVILTHGPAAEAIAASMAAEITAPGHDHDHGPGHDDARHDHRGGPPGGHNPTDHDHQLHALICQATNAAIPLPDKKRCALSDVFRQLALEGPMRPPRSV